MQTKRRPLALSQQMHQWRKEMGCGKGKRGELCSPAPSTNYEGLGKLLDLSKPQLLKMVIPSSEGLQRINVHTQQMVAISIMPLELI